MTAHELRQALLQNRVALITGSGRGSGRAVARLFVAGGASVFLTARSNGELQSTSAEINRHAGREAAAYITADLSRADDCTRVFTEARNRFGRVDIVVNNAGHY